MDSIMELAKVSQSEAKEIEEVINNEWLLDWSECSTAQFKKAIRLAQQFIDNDYSWEFTA